MFHLFTYDQYYPQGGFGDYRGSFPTIEEARIAERTERRDYYEIAETTPDGSLRMVETG